MCSDFVIARAQKNPILSLVILIDTKIARNIENKRGLVRTF
jgi:hypothetical protein